VPPLITPYILDSTRGRGGMVDTTDLNFEH